MNFKFWRPREKFLILEIAPEKTSALFLGADGDRNLELEKIWDEFPLKKLNAAQMRKLRRRKIIVSAAPALIYTTAFPVKLARDSSACARPLTLVELENLLAQAMGKLFNGERKNASAHLGVDELDAILVNSKITNFKVEGHAVLNPVGFGGKTIEGVLELLFTTRQIFYGLKELFNNKDGFFFTGAHLAALRLIARLEPLPANLLLAGKDGVSYFILDRAAWGNAVYDGKIDWRLDSLWKAISSSLGTSREATMKLYNIFLRGGASADFTRSFRRILKPEMDKFLDEIKKSRLKGCVHLYSEVPFPFALPWQFGRITFCELPLEKALEKGGFKAGYRQWPLSPANAFMRLSPFFEFYYDKSGSDINNKLRRRLHWLMQE